MKAAHPRRNSKREDLIKAGIQEINKHGIAGFSMRRIADDCGLSCGAPYKHFENRKDFIAAVIEYVNGQWRVRQQELLDQYAGDLRRQIVEMSVGYVEFLMEHPHYRSILMLKDEEFDNTYHRLRGELSSPTQQLAQQFFDSVGMDDFTSRRKVYVVRSLIFGAVILMDNGEMAYNQETLEFIRFSINREFDLP
ncbi:MAG: TetR/AcrR family transcriptional regulator [Clostridiales bacterium]|uniref:TetR/AcrR family transcriptional regulator n=1 Tax=Evtepia sp. TaxID=2773933 RepID=UPI00298309AC|nr:TetR/AcrR family transcriptional regulator [Evtepia sp.]MDD7289412.1 TetR/AcrR family transcriptional regulator [Clostridiales bacterium]MDY3993310.1 TetR/AcrR family transcriptional regulator [Evtepia sp.]MDY4429594.1 TetR/AcrR family transcriptional regulator [Evtepia sp.]